MLTRWKLQGFKANLLLLITLLFYTGAGCAQRDAKASGTITAVNILERTIQINEKVFALSDSLQVYSPSNSSLSQRDLAIDQKIEYSSGPTTNMEAQLPQQMVTQIHIMKGYDEGKAPKH